MEYEVHSGRGTLNRDGFLGKVGRMRPRKEISAEKFREIEYLAGVGLKDDQIAVAVDIPEATLQRRCRKNLQSGRAKCTAQVAQTAFRMAVGGHCPAMTIFWMKCRAGWREVEREVQVKAGDVPGSLVINMVPPATDG